MPASMVNANSFKYSNNNRSPTYSVQVNGIIRQGNDVTAIYNVFKSDGHLQAVVSQEFEKSTRGGIWMKGSTHVLAGKVSEDLEHKIHIHAMTQLRI